MFVLCVGLTDAQYNNGVREIIMDTAHEDTEYFVPILLKKAVRLRRNGSAGQKTGAECFMIDLYEAQTGSRDKHGAKHWVIEKINEDGVISE